MKKTVSSPEVPMYSDIITQTGYLTKNFLLQMELLKMNLEILFQFTMTSVLLVPLRMMIMEVSQVQFMYLDMKLPAGTRCKR